MTDETPMPSEAPPESPDEDPTQPASARKAHRKRQALTGAAVATALVMLITGFALSHRTQPESAAEPAADLNPTVTESTPETEAETTTTERPFLPAPPGRKPRRKPIGPPGPLTNAPVDLPGYERRPALVVKIDNADPDARPQYGITLADIVYEEQVEGSITRFAAIFQGADSEVIGPVRSGRSTDVQIVEPLNYPLFGFSGANGTFLGLIRGSKLVDVGAQAAGGAYYRGWDRPMPHNLYTSTAALFASAHSNTASPLWGFRSDNEVPVGSAPVSSASFTFGGATAVQYRWDPDLKGFVRSQNGSVHFDEDGWEVAPANVIIQFVDYVDSGVTDSIGSMVPEADLIGDGPAWVLTNGYGVPAHWIRDKQENRATFYGPAGDEIQMASGRTWVELVPRSRGAAVYRADGSLWSYSYPDGVVPHAAGQGANTSQPPPSTAPPPPPQTTTTTRPATTTTRRPPFTWPTTSTTRKR